VTCLPRDDASLAESDNLIDRQAISEEAVPCRG
jgi:hypothetical protein